MPRRNAVMIALLSLLAIAFALISYTATITKNPIGDEPLHAVAGFAHLREFDFRIDPEDPPLVEYWAMIPQPPDALKIDTDSAQWKEMIGYMWRQYTFVIPALYDNPNVDPDQFINRSRAMMAILGAALAGIIAWWTWDLAGPWAALIAVSLFTFDPNFLGHASLIKNDVPLSLVMCALIFAVYRAGQRLTIVRAMTIAVLIAAALTVKFSGLLIFVIAAIVLLGRAVMKRPWLALGNIIVEPARKFAAAAATIALSAVVGYVGIWACYGFRYAPTPDPAVGLNTSLILQAGLRNQFLNQSGGVEPTADQLDRARQNLPLLPKIIDWMDARQLLPQAWLAGLLDTWATTQRRPAFLIDQHSDTGWWYYFPLAILFKTPLATLALFALSAIVALRWRVVDHQGRFDRWAIFCIFTPVALYMLSAMTSNLNLGIRHLLPIYPLLYVWTAAALAPGRPERRSRITIGLVAVLLLGLIASSVSAYPNYVAFFNFASGGSRGGLRLLGDSNLDWGQDLKLLARWQHDHPDTTIYLDYFGGVEPSHYVNFKPLFASENAPIPDTPMHENVAGAPRVMAISATKLQGIYPPSSRIIFYQDVQHHAPLAVLGGTIYLYRLPMD